MKCGLVLFGFVWYDLGCKMYLSFLQVLRNIYFVFVYCSFFEFVFFFFFSFLMRNFFMICR